MPSRWGSGVSNGQQASVFRSRRIRSPTSSRPIGSSRTRTKRVRRVRKPIQRAETYTDSRIGGTDLLSRQPAYGRAVPRSAHRGEAASALRRPPLPSGLDPTPCSPAAALQHPHRPKRRPIAVNSQRSKARQGQTSLVSGSISSAARWRLPDELPHGPRARMRLDLNLSCAGWERGSVTGFNRDIGGPRAFSRALPTVYVKG